jgi:hypothetical protein
MAAEGADRPRQQAETDGAAAVAGIDEGSGEPGAVDRAGAEGGGGLRLLAVHKPVNEFCRSLAEMRSFLCCQ